MKRIRSVRGFFARHGHTEETMVVQRTKGDACQALAASVSPLSATLWPVNYGRAQWYMHGIVRGRARRGY